MTIGKDIFTDDIHFETVDIRPVTDMFFVETIGMKTSKMNGEIIGKNYQFSVKEMITWY